MSRASAATTLRDGPQSGARPMKMKDLEAATGVGRETIRYYIREGLLPEPTRPGRNVAWYDESFVERVRLIKDLQQQRFLPLRVIKAVLGAGDAPSQEEARTLRELDGRLAPLVAGAAAASAEPIGVVAERAGITLDHVRRLAASGLVEITAGDDGAEALDATGARIVELWGKLHAVGFREELGFGPEQMGLYADFVGWLAREELKLFTQGVTGKRDRETITRMAEAGIAHVNAILALLREATLLRYIAEGNVPG